MDFLRNLFNRGEARTPKTLKNSLLKHFPKAKNVEWSRYNELYEAMFYDEEVEKIARFDQNGKLVECRINTSFTEIPSFVKSNIEPDYEIMSCIVVYASDNMNYELIVRNSELIRYSLLMDSLGHKIRLERL